MKKSIFILIMSLALIAGGCMDYQEDLVLNNDGSGTVKMHYSIDKEYLKTMESMAKSMAGSTGENKDDTSVETMFSKDDIEKALRENGTGIKLVSFKTDETDAAREWTMEFSFDDINKFDVLMSAVTDKMPDFEAAEDTMSIFGKQSDGTYLFSRPLMEDEQDNESAGYNDYPEYSDDEAADDEYSEDDMADDESSSDDSMAEYDYSDDATEISGEDMEKLTAGMNAMMQNIANHSVRVSVKFPGKILDTNATSVDGSTAVWEYTLDKLQDAPPRMTAVIAP